MVLVSPLRSCSLGLRHAFAMPPSTTHGVTKILVQYAGHLETIPRIVVSRHDILRVEDMRNLIKHFRS